LKGRVLLEEELGKIRPQFKCEAWPAVGPKPNYLASLETGRKMIPSSRVVGTLDAGTAGPGTGHTVLGQDGVRGGGLK
jgi:hypothetical protein